MGEQRLMAAVDTVEVADGQCARRTAFSIGKTAEDSHDSGFEVERAECRKTNDYKRSAQWTAARRGFGVPK
jgi:hypothetical protein